MDQNEVLASSLADCVLADAILIPPRSPIPPTTIIKVRGLQKVRKQVTKKLLLVNEKRDVGMAKLFSKEYGNNG